MNNVLIIGTQLESLSTRKDKTVKLIFGTQELTPDQGWDLIALNGQFCYMALKVDQFSKSESEIIDGLQSDFEIKGKSQGQRLRNVLYRLFEQNNEGFTEFSKYYDHKMEKIIEFYKSKLES